MDDHKVNRELTCLLLFLKLLMVVILMLQINGIIERKQLRENQEMFMKHLGLEIEKK